MIMKFVRFFAFFIVAIFVVNSAYSSNYFTPNEGQISNNNIKAYISLKNYTVSFTSQGFTYHVYENVDDLKPFSNTKKIPNIKQHQLSISLPNYKWELEYKTPTKEITNFYKNNTNLTINEVYEGLTYTSDMGVQIDFFVVDGMLKYNIIFSANTKVSEFSISASKPIRYNNEKLIHKLNRNIKIEERFPEVYTLHQDVKEAYPLPISIKGRKINYSIPKINKKLVIDPVAYSVKYGSYYGGNNVEYIHEIKSDSKKNIIAFGYSLSPNNIATSGAHQTSNSDFDAFIVKMDSLGNRLWGTYYGGDYAERTRAGTIDENDNIIITANTFSANNISTLGAHQPGPYNSNDDACLAMFSPQGILKWGTYYGGNGHDFINDIVYYNGELIMTGHTESSVNMVTVGAHQTTYNGISMAFLTKFDTLGNLLYGSYYGNGNDDSGNNVAVTTNGDILLSGNTKSAVNISTAGTHQPTINAMGDAFLSKWTNNGNLIWGTYFGGANREIQYGLTTFNNHVYITGHTESTAGIATTGAQQTSLNSQSDGYLADFNLTNGTLTKATYVGGNQTEILKSIAYANNFLYVFGSTQSTTNIANKNGFQTHNNGGEDFILLVFDTLCNKTVGSYYGGAMDDFGTSLAVLDNNKIAVAGFTATTNGLTTSNAHQQTYGGFFYDGFISIICRPNALTTLNYSDSVALCQGNNLTLTSLNTFPSYNWSGGSTSSSINVSTPGKYWLETIDANNCPGRSDTVYVYHIAVDSSITFPKTTLCAGDSINITANASYSNYLWTNGDTTNQITVKDSGEFFVQFTDSAGCLHFSDTVNITYIPNNYDLSYAGSLTPCLNDNISLFWADSLSLQSIFWNNIQTTYSINPAASGGYYATGTDTNGCTIQSDTITIQFINNPNPILNFSGGVYPLCGVDTLQFTADSGYVHYQWSNGDTVRTVDLHTPGNYYVTVTDTNGCLATSDTLEVVQSNLTGITVGSNVSSPACYSSLNKLTASPQLANVLWNTGSTNFQITPSSAYNQYYYSGQDSLGCPYNSDTLQLQIYPYYTDSITSSHNPPYCSGSSVNLAINNPEHFDILWNTNDTTDGILVNTSGSYYVQLTDTNGCITYTDTVTVNFVNTQTPVVSWSTDTLCLQDSLHLTLVNDYLFDSYTWSNNDTVANTSYYGSFVGIIQVTLTTVDTNGCVSTFSHNFYVESCTGINENIRDNFVIYPNPTNGKLFIKTKTLNWKSLDLYTVEGKKVINQINTTHQTITNIDLSQFEKGVYLLSIELKDNQRFYHKIIKH